MDSQFSSLNFAISYLPKCRVRSYQIIQFCQGRPQLPQNGESLSNSQHLYNNAQLNIYIIMALETNEEEMMYRWMELANPGIKCSHLHCDTSCAYQVYYKITRSIGKGFKFYIILHMIPFLLYKAKKIKDLKKFKAELYTLIRKYIGSLLFMGTMVGGIKTFLCFSQKITKPEPTFKGEVFIWGSLLSSLSIFFEDPHRREEIVYFVFVRALRSSYVWAKKRKYILLPNEESSIFIALFAILAYIFDKRKQVLKGQDLVERLWGTS